MTTLIPRTWSQPIARDAIRRGEFKNSRAERRREAEPAFLYIDPPRSEQEPPRREQEPEPSARGIEVFDIL